MPLNIRSDEVNDLADQLARKRRVSKTQAVRDALRNELRRIDETVPLRERLRPLQESFAALPATGLSADKAFYDDLSGDE